MIILRNRGEIDIDVIKTMGVNVKDAASPIGFFGTGLKYAIAVFLREGVELSLFIGTNKYAFITEQKVIRGKSFDLCKMQGPFDIVDLGFTTDLGRNWELWQAYREIHSNCLDEGGEIYTGEVRSGVAGETIFCLPDMDTTGIFLDASSPRLFSGADVDIYEGESSHIYYNGIRAKDLDRPSIYTYNIKRECKLTEDRLLCYDFQVQHAINESIARMDNADIIEQVITAHGDRFESTLNMHSNNYAAPSAAFVSVYKDRAKDVHSSVRDYVVAHMPRKELSASEKRQKMLDELTDFCDSWGLSFARDDGAITLTGEMLADDE